MSNLQKAAKAWRQTELEKKGDKFWYRPRTVNEAFVDGAKWERERILSEAEKYKFEVDTSCSKYHTAPDDVVRWDELEKIIKGGNES